MKPLLHRLDTSLTSVITSWPAGLEPFFLATTALGGTVATLTIGLGVVAYGYAHTSPRLWLSGVAIWLTFGIGSAIKLAVGRARPLTEYAAGMWPQTHSFPSGHATGATVAYGLLAYLAWQLLPQPWNHIAAALLVLLIILIGISRVYLGAHFPSDVIAGWLLGAVALCIIIFVVRPLA